MINISQIEKYGEKYGTNKFSPKVNKTINDNKNFIKQITDLIEASQNHIHDYADRGRSPLQKISIQIINILDKNGLKKLTEIIENGEINPSKLYGIEKYLDENNYSQKKLLNILSNKKDENNLSSGR